MSTEKKKRYHLRVKPILCLTAEEAIASGVSVNEDKVEAVVLVPNPVTAAAYAVIRTEPEEVLSSLTPSQRGERIFQRRNEAMAYLRSQDPGMFRLYGVVEAHVMEREQISAEADPTTVNEILRQMEAFDAQDRKKDRD